MAKKPKIIIADDGLLASEVGKWANEKHGKLRRYLNISRAARRKFVEGYGGATYIELFCGAGRSALKETNEFIPGSPIVAFETVRDGDSPFTEIHLADASTELVNACETRLLKIGAKPTTYVGPASELTCQENGSNHA